MSLKSMFVAFFLAAVCIGCGGEAPSSTPASTGGAAPAETPAQPVQSLGSPSEP